MTLLYRDARFLAHETGSHPERALRLRAVESHLERHWLAAQCRQPTFEPCDRRGLALVHAPAYIEEIWAFARAGGGYLDADTVCSTATFDVAALAAGAVVDAVGRVLQGEDPTALCLVRPPGHHALAAQAMGFCIFNNVALGAMAAVEQFGLDRVLIVDFDVHHGNGTQDIFWNDKSVLYASSHEMPAYPGTGALGERGEHDNIVNAPLRAGDAGEAFREAYEVSLLPRIEAFGPDLIVISAGFDAHFRDPLGNLRLREEDFAWITRKLMAIAQRRCQGRVVSLLEGGYDLDGLARSVAAHVGALMGG